MKDRHAPKHRPVRRKDKQRHPGRSGPVFVGGSLDAALVATIAAAAAGVDRPGAWPAVAPRVLPVLTRIDQPFPPGSTPVLVTVPPSIRTGFGIDLGPAFGHISEAMLATWGVDRATLLGTALDNLRRTVAEVPPRVQRFRFQGRDILGIQGEGWGSSLVLLPDVLGPILGRDPRILITPVRNTLIALDEGVDLPLVIEIWEALADGAPDELDADLLRWTGTTVAALAATDIVGRPN